MLLWKQQKRRPCPQLCRVAHPVKLPSRGAGPRKRGREREHCHEAYNPGTSLFCFGCRVVQCVKWVLFVFCMYELFVFPLADVCYTCLPGPAHAYLLVHKAPWPCPTSLSGGGRQARKDTMKLFVCLSVLVCVVSLALAYPSRYGDSLAKKKEELLALEQELQGMMERAGQCCEPLRQSSGRGGRGGEGG